MEVQIYKAEIMNGEEYGQVLHIYFEDFVEGDDWTVVAKDRKFFLLLWDKNNSIPVLSEIDNFADFLEYNEEYFRKRENVK